MATYPTPKTTRLDGIGASASFAIVHQYLGLPPAFGVTAHKVTSELIARRKGEEVDSPYSAAMKWGHRMEGGIREDAVAYLKEQGMDFLVVHGNDATYPIPCPINGIVSSPDTLLLHLDGIPASVAGPIIQAATVTNSHMALPDGEHGAAWLMMVAEARIPVSILEIKTASKYYEDLDDVPPVYKWQVSHQTAHLEAFGIKVLTRYIAALEKSTLKMSVLQVPMWNPVEFTHGWELLQQAWQGVEQGIAAPPYTPDEALAAYPKSADTAAISPMIPAMLTLEAKFKGLKEEEADLKKKLEYFETERKAVLAQILTAFGNNPKKIMGTDGKSLVSRIDTVKETIDAQGLKDLKAEYPHIFEKFSKISTTTYYR